MNRVRTTKLWDTAMMWAMFIVIVAVWVAKSMSGCSKPVEPHSEVVTGKVKLVFQAAEAPPIIADVDEVQTAEIPDSADRFDVAVSGDDFETIEVSVSRDPSAATEIVLDVPSGLGRTVHVSAWKTGLTYCLAEGSVEMEIIPGQLNSKSIELERTTGGVIIIIS